MVSVSSNLHNRFSINVCEEGWNVTLLMIEVTLTTTTAATGRWCAMAMTLAETRFYLENRLITALKGFEFVALVLNCF